MDGVMQASFSGSPDAKIVVSNGYLPQEAAAETGVPVSGVMRSAHPRTVDQKHRAVIQCNGGGGRIAGRFQELLVSPAVPLVITDEVTGAEVSRTRHHDPAVR